MFFDFIFLLFYKKIMNCQDYLKNNKKYNTITHTKQNKKDNQY